MLIKNSQELKVSKITLSKINELRNQYICILITNNMDTFSQFTVPSLKLNKYFDLIVNSHNTKLLKNDFNGLIFKQLVKKYHTNFNQCFVIDNSEKVCNLFTQLGGRSLHISENRDIDYYLSKL